ncbi:uncharacterized protein RJT21DRAFT_42769 [Scheffersomyces amazonensis]|uniref:uncharacterized protein n=1 Tax=Scheffersomyces amazonensis TaxID=1078765 RepID=UPI00315C6990
MTPILYLFYFILFYFILLFTLFYFILLYSILFYSGLSSLYSLTPGVFIYLLIIYV